VSGSDLCVNVAPVRHKFYVACKLNSINARSHGLADLVRVQLVKSFCLPLITYCIGAMQLKRSDLQQVSVCWNDAFRRVFHFKRSESVKILQVNLGTVDFKHLYDLYRWKFLTAIVNTGRSPVGRRPTGVAHSKIARVALVVFVLYLLGRAS